jgi:poly(3-hydroxybutyrate) depolymerase
VVSPSNGAAVARLWAGQLGATAGAPRELRRGQRHPMTVTDFKQRGRALVSLVEVPRLGHAWSGGTASQPYSDARGPDASRMAWAFVSRQFRRMPGTETPTKPATLDR